MTEEILKTQIHELKTRKPIITFKTDEMIYFREIEDLIAWFLQNIHKIKAVIHPAYKYKVEEFSPNHHRLYYTVKITVNNKEIELATGDATDFSGHGKSDMELAEYFIKEALKLPLEERPLSYLFDTLEYQLHKLTIKEAEV